MLPCPVAQPWSLIKRTCNPRPSALYKIQKARTVNLKRQELIDISGFRTEAVMVCTRRTNTIHSHLSVPVEWKLPKTVIVSWWWYWCNEEQMALNTFLSSVFYVSLNRSIHSYKTHKAPSMLQSHKSTGMTLTAVIVATNYWLEFTEDSYYHPFKTGTIYDQ